MRVNASNGGRGPDGAAPSRRFCGCPALGDRGAVRRGSPAEPCPRATRAPGRWWMRWHPSVFEGGSLNVGAVLSTGARCNRPRRPGSGWRCTAARCARAAYWYRGDRGGCGGSCRVPRASGDAAGIERSSSPTAQMTVRRRVNLRAVPPRRRSEPAASDACATRPAVPFSGAARARQQGERALRYRGQAGGAVAVRAYDVAPADDGQQ